MVLKFNIKNVSKSFLETKKDICFFHCLFKARAKELTLGKSERVGLFYFKFFRL